MRPVEERSRDGESNGARRSGPEHNRIVIRLYVNPNGESRKIAREVRGGEGPRGCSLVLSKNKKPRRVFSLHVFQLLNYSCGNKRKTQYDTNIYGFMDYALCIMDKAVPYSYR